MIASLFLPIVRNFDAIFDISVVGRSSFDVCASDRERNHLSAAFPLPSRTPLPFPSLPLPPVMNIACVISRDREGEKAALTPLHCAHGR